MKHFLLLGLWLNLLASSVWAHPMNSTLMLLDIHEQNVKVELRIPLAELSAALQENLTSGNSVFAHETTIKTYLLEHVRVSTPQGQAWVVKIEGLVEGQPVQTGNATYRELEAHLQLIPPIGFKTRTFSLHYDAVIHAVPNHIALVSIRQDWQSGITPELEPTTVGVIRLDPIGKTVLPLEVNRSSGNVWRGFVGMFRVGWLHIAEGTDHLLFLLTLLLPSVLRVNNGRWSKFVGLRESLLGIVKIVTAFTVGHSLTLIFGAIFQVKIPTQPIEALIALSILVSALHALHPVFPKREVWVAGGFGLIHGMAFSFTLAGLQLSAGQLAISLLGFNLGIEAMQLVVIALTIPWLILLAPTPIYAPLRTIGGIVAATAALGWLGQRLGWENPLGSLADALSPHGAWLIVGLATLALVSSVAQQWRPSTAKPSK